MSIAELGFSIDSSRAAGAAVDLDKLASAAKRAEVAEGRLAAESRKAGQALGAAGKAAQQAARATDGLEANLNEIAAAYRSGALAGTEMGRTLDNLRARFNPVFAASKAYEQALEELNQAHRIGAISSREYGDALQRLNANYAQVATGSQAAAASLQTANMSMRQSRAMARQLSFQLVDIGQAIPLAFQSPAFALQNFGFQIAQIGQLYAGQGGMRAALRDSISMVGRFAARFAPAAIAVTALGGAFVGLASEINETSDVQVTAMDTFVATIQLARDAIYDLLRPAIEAIAPWFSTVWDLVVRGVRDTGNFIINSFRIAFDQIATVWSSFPDMIGAAAIGAANIVIRTVNQMVRAAAQALNPLILMVNQLPGVEFEFIGDVGDVVGEIQNDAADRVAEALAGLSARSAQIAASDPMGDLFEAWRDGISQRAQDRARSRMAGVGGGAGGGGASAADSQARELERLQDAFNGIIMSGQEFIAMQEMERQALGMTEEAANALRFEHDMLNDALRAGIDLTPEQAAQIRQLAGDMAAAEASTKALAEAQRMAQETLDDFKDASESAFRGFIDDIQNGIHWLDALLSALNKIADKILDIALDDLFNGTNNLGSLFGSIGGLLGGGGSSYAGLTAGEYGGSFLSDIGSLIGGLFEDGAALHNGRVTAFAHGGIVSRPTIFPMADGAGLMGEAGPEAIMPLKRGADGRLGVEMAKPANDPKPVTINMPIYVQDQRGVREAAGVLAHKTGEAVRRAQSYG